MDRGNEIVSYLYDALGRRVAKIFPDGSEYGDSELYILDDRWKALEMYKGRTTPYYRWVDGAGIDEHLLIESDIDGDGFEDAEREYVCTDDLGSTARTVSHTGTVSEIVNYDPYGRPQLDAPQEAYLFTGRRYDPETGLYYYRNRYYDPVLGRFGSREMDGRVSGMFISTEPGTRPIQTTPVAGLYDYYYAAHDPSSYIDPIALKGVKPTRSGLLFVATCVLKARKRCRKCFDKAQDQYDECIEVAHNMRECELRRFPERGEAIIALRRNFYNACKWQHRLELADCSGKYTEETAECLAGGAAISYVFRPTKPPAIPGHQALPKPHHLPKPHQLPVPEPPVPVPTGG